MKLISFGLKAKIKYGRTKPTPKDKNIGNVIVEDCIKAYPRAAPINGAVHGDATTTARTPVFLP